VDEKKWKDKKWRAEQREKMIERVIRCAEFQAKLRCPTLLEKIHTDFVDK
jgi:hypothetical protein